MAAAKDAALEGFLSRGWEEAGLLGVGARGQVLRVRRRGCGGPGSALKLTSVDEVRALQELSSCMNVVALEETFASPCRGEAWARLELLEGGSLRGLLRARRLLHPPTLPEDTARCVLSQVLQGLQDMHRAGWMHRDLKAENIGIREPAGQASVPRVKLLDFDSAVRVPPRPQKLADVVGTVENMAPEVFDGQYDERADCWSLGVVAYECLFGYRPFNDASAERVEEMVRLWDRYLHFPSEGGVGREARDLVHGLLRDREARLSSAEALRHRWLQASQKEVRFLGGGAAPESCEHHAAVRDEAPPKVAAVAEVDLGDPGNAACWFGVPRCVAPPVWQRVQRAASCDEVSSLQRLRRSLSEWSVAQSQASAPGKPPDAAELERLRAVRQELELLPAQELLRGRSSQATRPPPRQQDWAPASPGGEPPGDLAKAQVISGDALRQEACDVLAKASLDGSLGQVLKDILADKPVVSIGTVQLDESLRYGFPRGTTVELLCRAPPPATELERLRALRQELELLPAQELLRGMSSQATSPPPPRQQEGASASPGGVPSDHLAKDKRHLWQQLEKLQEDLDQALMCGLPL